MRSTMHVAAPGKAVLLGLIVAGCFAYIVACAISGSGETTPAWATITLIAGYVTGNTVGARAGHEAVGVFGPSQVKEG